MILVPCNSKDHSSNDDVGIGEKKSDGENVQDIQVNSKDLTTTTENILVQLQCKQLVAETNNENASTCANEVLVSSLK